MSTRVIYKIGFPDATPWREAMDTAMDAFYAYLADEKYEAVGTPQTKVVTSDAHKAAGEYLVQVESERRPLPDPASPAIDAGGHTE